MPATPFGGHPTLGQYVAWATTQGCITRYGTIVAEDGRPSRIMLIETADKKRWVAIIEVMETEYLVPSHIARLDRRLGLRSPFFSVDPDKPDVSY